MANSKRTYEEIRDAVYAACNGDWIDESARISELQTKLILALQWVECAPVEGWRAVADRQIQELKDIEASWVSVDGDADYFLGVVSNITPPSSLRQSIARSSLDREPWDIDAVDEFIREHK